MEEIQEKSLHRETARIEIAATRTPFDEIDEGVRLAIRCAADKKATDIVALDLREITSFTEFFVIASGANLRQVQAIADEVREQLKEQLGLRSNRVEGYEAAEWELMDFSDFIVQVFEKTGRGFYVLERLWLDARRVEIPEGL